MKSLHIVDIAPDIISCNPAYSFALINAILDDIKLGT